MKRALIFLMTVVLAVAWSFGTRGGMAGGPAGETVKESPPGAAMKEAPTGRWMKGPPSAKGKHNGKGAVAAHEFREQEAEENFHGSFFRPQHTLYLRQCYTQPGGLPPGLQKQLATTGHLPPGLEKQLRRNGHLPPGLEKKMVLVTTCVDRRIGPLPPDTRLYLMGRDAYLINEHTRAIIDILRSAY